MAVTTIAAMMPPATMWAFLLITQNCIRQSRQR
jgi:hypothetical protein